MDKKAFGAAVAVAGKKTVDPTVVTQAVDDWLEAHPEATTTVQDGAVSYQKLDSTLKGKIDDVGTLDTDVGNLKTAIDDLEDAVANKANVDGSYPDMTVGNAEQLVATIGIEDAVPYNFRTAGGSVDIGDREVDKIVGGTLAFNQLVKNGNFADGTNDWSTYDAECSTLSVSNGVATVTFIAMPDLAYKVMLQNYDGVHVPTGAAVIWHKYLVSAEVFSANSRKMVLSHNSNSGFYYKLLSANTWTTMASIFNAARSTAYVAVSPQEISDITVGDAFQVKNVVNFDLTQMFGTTIADYIYSLEQATAGAGVAFFRKLFPKPYYAYNAGELMSVQASAHKMVGFNQFDKSTVTLNTKFNSQGQVVSDNNYVLSDYIKVVPGATYYFKNVANLSTSYAGAFYDADKTLIEMIGIFASGGTINASGSKVVPANCVFMRVVSPTAYFDDCCINLSWDGERDGEYAPYQAWEYPLDSDLTLRGIPKLDADNNLYYDGDTYESDGTVTRRYGIVDLGTLNWAHPYANRSRALVSGFKVPTSYAPPNAVAEKYIGIAASGSLTDGQFAIYTASGEDVIIFYYDGVNDPSGYLVYELAEPTTESADPYQNPQIVEDFGTEEYVDTRDVAIPVGHDTTYRANLRAKLEMSPNSPDGDGDYIVRQANGQNEYVLLTKELPAAPTSDGNYILKCTVASGAATYTWEAQT